MSQKKFKHIPTGNIAVETNSEKNYKVSEPKNFTIPKWIVENSNEWKKIIEKDFEILTVSSTKENDVYTKGTIINNRFTSEELLESASYYWNINSIKRLSDREVFSVGDAIQLSDSSKGESWWPNNNCIISEIYITNNNEIGFKISQGELENFTYEFPLYRWRKASKVLFTTCDGVDIYEGDEYWLIESNFTPCRELYAQSDKYVDSKMLKVFYSYEAALKYIDENKPKYSKREIKDAIKSSFETITAHISLNTDAIQYSHFDEERFKIQLNL